MILRKHKREYLLEPAARTKDGPSIMPAAICHHAGCPKRLKALPITRDTAMMTDNWANKWLSG